MSVEVGIVFLLKAFQQVFFYEWKCQGLPESEKESNFDNQKFEEWPIGLKWLFKCIVEQNQVVKWVGNWPEYHLRNETGYPVEDY